MDGKLDELFVDEVRDIIAQAGRDGIAIAGFDGTGDPVVTEDEIALNGSAALGQEHESFILPTDYDGAGFCKTARMPYDAVVTAILVSAIVNKLGDDISSDGTYADWNDGIMLYERAVRKLKQGECQRLRRMLNHEFRPSVSSRLCSDGFAVLLCDVPRGEYTIKDLQDGSSIAAEGRANAIVYDAMDGNGTDGCCHSERLAAAIRDIVDRKRDSYRRKGGNKAARRDWLFAHVGTSGFSYIDALCF